MDTKAKLNQIALYVCCVLFLILSVILWIVCYYSNSQNTHAIPSHLNIAINIDGTPLEGEPFLIEFSLLEGYSVDEIHTYSAVIICKENRVKMALKYGVNELCFKKGVYKSYFMVVDKNQRMVRIEKEFTVLAKPDENNDTPENNDTAAPSFYGELTRYSTSNGNKVEFTTKAGVGVIIPELFVKDTLANGSIVEKQVKWDEVDMQLNEVDYIKISYNLQYGKILKDENSGDYYYISNIIGKDTLTVKAKDRENNEKQFTMVFNNTSPSATDSIYRWFILQNSGKMIVGSDSFVLDNRKSSLRSEFVYNAKTSLTQKSRFDIILEDIEIDSQAEISIFTQNPDNTNFYKIALNENLIMLYENDNLVKVIQNRNSKLELYISDEDALIININDNNVLSINDKSSIIECIFKMSNIKSSGKLYS